MIKLLKTSDTPALLVRLTVGLTFLAEGIQKFLFPELLGTGRFAKIGFSNPSFWASFTGTFEIFCSIFILSGCLQELLLFRF